jgi:hypothetical protein
MGWCGKTPPQMLKIQGHPLMDDKSELIFNSCFLKAVVSCDITTVKFLRNGHHKLYPATLLHLVVGLQNHLIRNQSYMIANLGLFGWRKLIFCLVKQIWRSYV